MNPQKSLNNSLKSLDHSQINKNALNTSVSKMQYSFPKTERFSQQQKSFSANKFYDIPSTKTMRSTSLGYGKKLDLGKKNFITPPPNRYTLSSDFRKDPKIGVTIAPGRGDVKANDMFYRALKQSPEPASYNPKHDFQSLKYSLHPRIEDHTDKWVKSVPGPGAYSYLDLTQKSKSPLSKHDSVKSGKFDHLPRLSEVQMRKNKNPGPNQYKNTAQILNTFKYPKKSGNTFSRGQRLGIMNKSIAPGPGAYSSFSEF